MSTVDAAHTQTDGNNHVCHTHRIGDHLLLLVIVHTASPRTACPHVLEKFTFLHRQAQALNRVPDTPLKTDKPSLSGNSRNQYAVAATLITWCTVASKSIRSFLQWWA